MSLSLICLFRLTKCVILTKIANTTIILLKWILGSRSETFFSPFMFSLKKWHISFRNIQMLRCSMWKIHISEGANGLLTFFITYKSCIQETLTLSTCTDCSTVTMKLHIFFSHFFVQFYAIFNTLLHLLAYIFFLSLFVMRHTSWVPCYISVVMCHMSCVTVTCHLPPVTNANSHSHGPSPANSIIRYILTLRISSAGYW